MAKLTWPHHEAQRLFKQVGGTKESVIFETGYGPSGLPHIGTFAEVARTTFVINAFKRAYPDVATRLIVFSDDLDGLRSLPDNVPNHDLLRPHLGEPLSSIPDPFGQEASFSAFMNRQLQNFLDYYGFTYEFYSSTLTYRSGRFDEGLRRIMDCYEPIRDLFTATISPDKRQEWSPFFPICAACGKIYTTRVTAIDKLNYTLSYRCDQSDGKYQPCGHVATTPITGGAVKVGWKVDWALRWFVLGVDYEMYGKDLIDSYAMSQKICALLGGKPPAGYKYELFLDENGAKISKKIGNGISMEQWQAYAPLGALLHFLLANPNKARQMGMPILPKIVDDYLKALRTEARDDEYGTLWFIDQLQHHHDASGLRNSEIGYALLVNVAENLGLHEGAVLFEYASRHDPSVLENEPFFRELCVKVVAYVQDYQAKLPQQSLDIDIRYAPYLRDLRQAVQALTDRGEFEANNLQNAVFTVSRCYGLVQSEWFKFLYQALIGKDKGSRMGTFLAVLGAERVLAMLDGAIARFLPLVASFQAEALEPILANAESISADENVHVYPIVGAMQIDPDGVWQIKTKALITDLLEQPLLLEGPDRESAEPIDAQVEKERIYQQASTLLSACLTGLQRAIGPLLRASE
ncbi:MAG: lysine--tRNA ligase [Gammaproteobacteria bacterium]|nr:lysine--tRNA ligase [Gammaproteobacteria bacterium]MCP5459101.1 lysine--tRNA ligase [Gammaproteobacteria bacterium]